MAASRKETEEKIKFQKKQAEGIGKVSLVQRECYPQGIKIE